MDPAMDMVILAAAQWSLGRIRPLPLLACAAMLRIFTLLALALGRGFAHWLHLPLLMLCAGILAAGRSLATLLQTAGCLICLSAAAAGFCMIGGWPAGFCGAAALSMLVRRSRHIRYRWNIEVELVLNGVTARFPALIDTGNRLREHRSGLPVLIVEEGAARNLAAAADALPESAKTALPYGVLGSTGEIICFQCDEIYVVLPGVGKTAAPNCRAAFYPGRIPGSVCALAPPEFADAAAQASAIQGIQQRARRVFLWHFQA